MTFVSWNCYGLSSEKFLRLHLNNTDFICLTETWLKPHTVPPALPGFTAFTSPRQTVCRGRGHGGTVIYVRNLLAPYCSIFRKSLDGDVLWLQARLPQLPRPIILGCVYLRPSEDHQHQFETLTTDLSDISSFGTPVLLGDFNARTGSEPGWRPDPLAEFIDAELPPRSSEDQEYNPPGVRMTSMCQSCDLVILNGRCWGDLDGTFTFNNTNGHSVIDYGLVPRPLLNYVNSFSVIAPTSASTIGHTTSGDSDHWMTVLHLQLPSPATVPKRPPRLRYDSRKVSDYCTAISDSIENSNLFSALQDSPLETAVTALHETICAAASAAFGPPRPPHPPRPRPAAWFDQELHAARTALRKAERQRDPTAPDLFHCPHLTPARLQYPELPYYTNDRRAMSDKPYLFARFLRHALPLGEHRLDQDAE